MTLSPTRAGPLPVADDDGDFAVCYLPALIFFSLVDRPPAGRTCLPATWDGAPPPAVCAVRPPARPPATARGYHPSVRRGSPQTCVASWSDRPAGGAV